MPEPIPKSIPHNLIHNGANVPVDLEKNEKSLEVEEVGHLALLVDEESRLEKKDGSVTSTTSESKGDADDDLDGESKQLGVFRRLSRVLFQYGIETHGISPIPLESRTPPSPTAQTKTYQFFLIWFTANFNILAFGTGSAGPAFFGLGFKESVGVICVVDFVTCAVPAYFAVFGPKLGMRGMVQARYSWGLYGAMIPSILNVISSQGFLIVNSIIGGQALAAVSDKLDDSLGIVIISLVTVVVTFFGYRVVHWFESVAWIPNIIAFPLLLGLAANHLKPSVFPPPPSATENSSVASIFSFGSLLASFVISWCTFTPDYGVYHDASESTWKIFIYSYLGFFISCFSWQILGAALTIAATADPAWSAAFAGSNVGQLVDVVLSPAKGFGKLVLVLMAVSTASACAPTMYTFGTSFMAVTPVFARVPRYMFALLSEAILVPVAIIGAKRFYATLVDIISVIGYWAAAFASIVLIEHFLFRCNTFSTYTLADWNTPSKLPIGFAAIVAFLVAIGTVVPFMQQTWYTGPVAKAGSGDLGVLAGAVVGGLVYVVLRRVERRVFPQRRA